MREDEKGRGENDALCTHPTPSWGIVPLIPSDGYEGEAALHRDTQECPNGPGEDELAPMTAGCPPAYTFAVCILSRIAAISSRFGP
jgi:hypothetical protein